MRSLRSTIARLGSALLVSLVLAACSDNTVVSPDAAFNPGVAKFDAVPGTPDWLAPLGGGSANPATFDPTAINRVQVCVWVGGACTGPLTAQFSTTPSAGVGTLTANTAAGRYEASLSLMSTSFLTRRTYRISAMHGTTEVRSILVDIVRGRWALTRPDGTLAPLAAASALPIQFHVAAPLIRVNEVESNGGTPGDWVEITNIGTTTSDVSGFAIKDNDDTHIFTIPAGTTVAPGAFVVLDVGPVFGLGGADMARVYSSTGLLVDSYTWTAHAATTYGRCPDGTGAFKTTTTSTRGTANDCSIPNTIKINEIESSGGTPGDWIELTNTGALSVDISGFVLKDNDDTHVFTIPSGTTIAAGAYLALDVEVNYGLGGADAARLFNKTAELLDSYTWTAHAATTYGRCPNGTGPFITTTAVTRGTANNCTVVNTIVLNEVESSGGTPGDWVEITNIGTTTVDISGFLVKDNDDTHVFTVAPGTMIAAGAYLALDVEVNFGLGSSDAARLFDSGGTLLDSYTWTAHAASTWGRCPNGTGTFGATTSSKGAANGCTPVVPVGPTTETWAGTDNVAVVDAVGTFASNASGLMYERGTGGAADVLWVAQNGPGSIHRLLFNGFIWTRDASNGWAAGKSTRYTDGTGEPDTEDLTFTTGSAAGMYIVSERNNQANSISRPSILRYDVTGTGTSLTATNEWNLTADLPVVAANSGLEGITWIPDNILVAQGFRDVNAGHLYNPAEYPNNGGGLFFVGLEGNGMIYVYALNHTNSTFTRIASVATGFPSGVMALSYDRELTQLWATCDDTCGGLSDIFIIDATPGSPTLGQLKLTHVYARPSTMPNINNEGFTFAPQAACVAGFKPVFWSDDNATGGNSLRSAMIPCVRFP